MQRIARSRAAHFAHFSPDWDGAGEYDPHVGGTDARHLGPWNSAVELAEARHDVREKRHARIRESADQQPQQEAWVPRRDPGLGPLTPAPVPTLASLALDEVVSNIEDVESLSGLPDIVKTQISSRVCARRAMSRHAINLFTEDQPGELVVADCTLLEPAELAEALGRIAGPRLEVIDLGLCGRGMTDGTARQLAARGPFPALHTLRLGGAYRLRDGGLLPLLRACPALRTLGVPQASRLVGEALEDWAAGETALLEIDLADDRGIDGNLLLRTLPLLGPLHTADLSGCDVPLRELLCAASVLPTLRELTLTRCPGVSDELLGALATAHPGLASLVLDDCVEVTGAGVAALARSCRTLGVLSLRRCYRVGEDALADTARLCTISSLCVAGVPAAGAIMADALAAHCGRRLHTLDVSWCRGLRDGTLGALVDACPHLTRLEVWGCTQLTPAFLYGHGGQDLTLVGRGEPLRPVAAA